MSTSIPFRGHSSAGSLTSHIKIVRPIENRSPDDKEDWPEYLRMQYPGATIIYESGSFGDIEIRLPPASATDKDSDLMAHYLWDSSLLLSQLISGSTQHKQNSRWSVQGLQVLELGSGTGLVGMVCALAGADRATLTDYPSTNILKNIRHNIETNAIAREQSSLSRQSSSVSVEAHKWGDIDENFAKSNAHKYTRVLATGCLWLPEQHENIAKSMAHFLAKNEKAEVWVVSGFFLGRQKLAQFFDIARTVGLQAREVFEQNAVGDKRQWMVDRGLEDMKEVVEQGWLLVVVLCQEKDELS